MRTQNSTTSILRNKSTKKYSSLSCSVRISSYKILASHQRLYKIDAAFLSLAEKRTSAIDEVQTWEEANFLWIEASGQSLPCALAAAQWPWRLPKKDFVCGDCKSESFTRKKSRTVLEHLKTCIVIANNTMSVASAGGSERCIDFCAEKWSKIPVFHILKPSESSYDKPLNL